MKQTTRKLLSLLMALAIVLSLAPTAWAEELEEPTTEPTTPTEQTEPAEATEPKATISIKKDEDNKTEFKVGDTITFAVTVTKNSNTISSVALVDSSSPETTLKSAADKFNGENDQETVDIAWQPETAGKYKVKAKVTYTNNSEEQKLADADDSTVYSSEVEITVNSDSVAATQITLDESNLKLAISGSKKTGTLTAKLTPTNATDEITWTSSDPKVATVKPDTTGMTATVTAVAAGEATITAKCGEGEGPSATCKVTVSDNPSLSVPTGNITLSSSGSGSTSTLTATLSGVSANNVKNYSVLWTVTDTNIVKITSDGNKAGRTYTGSFSDSATTSTVAFAAVSAGTTTITAELIDENDKAVASKKCTVTVGNTFTLEKSPSTGSNNTVNINSNSSYWNYDSYGYYVPFSVSPYLNNTSLLGNTLSGTYDVYYTWRIGTTTSNTTIVQSNYSSYSGYNSYNSVDPYLYRFYSDNYGYNYGYAYNYTLTCTVDVYLKGTTVTTRDPDAFLASETATWNINNGYSTAFTVTATVYDGNSGYSLADTPDEGSTSIATQIDNWVRNYYYGTSYSSYYDYYRVRIPGGTGYATNSSSSYRGSLTPSSSISSSGLSYSQLDEIVFTPLSSVGSSTGSYTVSFPFYVDLYYYNSGYTGSSYQTVSGTMAFTVKQGSTSGGDITYAGQTGKDVTFALDDFEDFWTNRYPSGYLTSVVFSSPSGTPSGTVYNSSNKAVGSSSYYVSPSGSQSGLDGVYFSPSSSKTGTVNIRFTATGRANSSTSSSTTLNGTVVITYLSTAANKITYTTNSSGTVALSAQDFIDAYKKAVNTSSTPSNLSIQFQDVPAYGTLTYTGGSRDVRLTSSNVKNYKFNARTSGSSQIGDVTYSVSGSRNDTISYIGYIGSTATFTGEVTFNAITAPTNVSVTYYCATAAGINLTPANFTNANSAMSYAAYVTLGNPRTGSLSYIGGSTSNPILINTLANVTYKPAAGAAGTSTDTFTFTAFDTNSTVVASGTVTVTINLPAAPSTPSNPNAITSVNQFADVPAAGGTADWYRTPLSYLIDKGVINGQGDGKFGPDKEVEFSAALKFILNAVGIFETEVTNMPGVNWAQNYKNRAVNAGWISSDVDLTKPIGRTAMVELAAKALGISASTATSPFTDSTNRWAVALYYTTPRIITGSNDLSGKLVFKPDDPLRRDEMVCIVYRMYQYSAQNGTQYNSYLNYDET